MKGFMLLFASFCSQINHFLMDNFIPLNKETPPFYWLNIFPFNTGFCKTRDTLMCYIHVWVS